MPQSAYLNFDIHIIARLDGTFRARVAAMPLKIDNEEPTSTFSVSRATESLIERFLSETADTTHETLARQLGIILFRTLFNGPILPAYLESLPIAIKNSRYGLRIRLNLEHAPQLSHIPWELMHNTRDYIAVSPKTSLIRYPRQILPRRREKLSLPLRVLLIISSPDGFPPLDGDRERRLFETSISPLRHAGQLTTDTLENPTPSDLHRQLKAARYHVLHFIGYTQADPETYSGYLVFASANDDATTDLIRADTLARQITEENTIRFVFLDTTDTLASAAIVSANFIARGLPAVITPQFPISPPSHTQLINETYHTLVEYYPVDEAITRARDAIRSRHPVEWASPVLYTHSTDGQIFSRPISRLAQYTFPEIPLRLRFAAVGILGLLLVLVLLVALIGTDNILANNDDDQSNPTPILNTDLRINSITLNPNSSVSGDDTTFHLQIENIGTEPSPITAYELHLSHTTDTTARFSDEIPPILPNQTIDIEIAVSIQESGVFLAQIILDYDNRLTETNEHNNVRSIPFIITQPEVPE
jgi:hypothetical protein